MHGLVYSSDAEATRAFLRDRLGLPHSDVGEGWLIFDLPGADLGVHPLDDQGRPPAGTHAISLYCDDIRGTVAGLRARGVSFRGGVEDRGYGLVTHFAMPGGIEVELYEPRYAKGPRAPAKRKPRQARSAGRGKRRPAARKGRRPG
jgi:hypothetical protein